MTIDANREIQSLIAKAAQADKSEDAIRFSQAASNISNTLRCLQDIEEVKHRLKE